MAAKRKSNSPVVTGSVLKVFIVPTFLSNSSCPHCGHYNFEEVLESETGKVLLTNCQACDKEYHINIQQVIKQQQYD